MYSYLHQLGFYSSVTNIVRSVQDLKYNHSVIKLAKKELEDYWNNEKKLMKILNLKI